MGERGRLFAALALLPPLLLAADADAGQAGCQALARLSAEGAYGVADTRGRLLEECNTDRPMVPASVLKLATVSAALAILGPDYRFRTELYGDGQGNLFIRGFGDPTLVSEEIAHIVDQLRRRGLRRVATLFIDNSAFALESQVPGREESDNPYDAPVGPLSVNFNTLSLRRSADGQVVSDEQPTPTLPLMAELGRARPAGSHRLNICPGGCDAERRMAEYSGQLFKALLEEGGVKVTALGGIRAVPAQGGKLIYTHYSRKTLAGISRSLLKYSSNFTANLVYLACGAHRFGYPATWAKARKAVGGELARQLGTETAAAIVQEEGSGLSRENRVTVRAMLALLARFRPRMDLLNNDQGVAIKTGTLTGVYTAAGFLPGGQAYVILLAQPANRRAEVLERLAARYGNIPQAGGPGKNP